MNKQVFNAILKTDLKSFVIKVFNELSPGATYMNNWHIDVICDRLMGMRNGQSNRLIINIPPRYMKSIICSVALPAWLLGHNPKTNIICVSYNDELAEKFASDCRRIMLSDWYQELFPMTQLHKSKRAVNDFETTHGGGRLSTSIGGTLTGRGADWIIIDDPLKPSDAMSDNQRNKVNEWYSSTLYSRLNDKNMGKILLVMQRLHQNDLTGHLLENSSNFELIKLPVVAVEDEVWIVQNRINASIRTITRAKGELLHEMRENMDVIEDLKQSMGEYDFMAQYQQEPCPMEGGIIKEGWLHYDNQTTFDRNDVLQVLLSWDTANKAGIDNAYSACVVIVVTKDRKLHLVDVYRSKWEIPELVKQAKEIYNQWRTNLMIPNRITMLVEDAASGIALNQFLKSGMFNIVPIKPQGDKIYRLMNCSVFIENGRLLFPKNAEQYTWWPDFKKELLGFPGTKYKDQVDALSQCINYVMQQM